ncbi:hypothetical protein HBI56_058520 [Parastagonospora nodorum]|uniref:Uncharacterized protein n=1 Tax=Phaeosphaeria nodorum (strain SN15 / ATCC MYA-4574 / FGSC 10173) TaxID=321614 RepID=A0A7U2I0I0_PHANO|nr:hypothetical protein HBH56_160120 [Parastagonospora nodorum]QRC97244.1 hypothetical protein JI435_410330 [Parastagonospora nodorum SN15]KAH3922447.1 hypothetical protein HBH54_224550 [Parastagonospora nodorum]KAH3947074.1 hypothetical protein HBH53_121790 [Parastagonospora nodorum]KAH3969786.1 hypothetical protein HBH52_169800 [Parastagonospora nodorum]
MLQVATRIQWALPQKRRLRGSWADAANAEVSASMWSRGRVQAGACACGPR